MSDPTVQIVEDLRKVLGDLAGGAGATAGDGNATRFAPWPRRRDDWRVRIGQGDHDECGATRARRVERLVVSSLGVVRRYPQIRRGVRGTLPNGVGSRSAGRSPDLPLVRRGNLGRLRDADLDGPADLGVEIISPESRVRDRGEQFDEYDAVGVKEYWLIDPLRRKEES